MTTSTLATASYLVVKPNVLAPGSDYKFILTTYTDLGRLVRTYYQYNTRPIALSPLARSFVHLNSYPGRTQYNQSRDCRPPTLTSTLTPTLARAPV